MSRIATRPANPDALPDVAVYTVKVAFRHAKRIWRRIEIRGDQTLAALHEAIFAAFDRFDEHLYSFYSFPRRAKAVGRRSLYDAAVEYTDSVGFENRADPLGKRKVYNAEDTRLGSLKLKPGQMFYYLFDFGDNWDHEITVEKVDGVRDEGRYPRITARGGQSPDQYADADE
jgi:hypothetical protein